MASLLDAAGPERRWRLTPPPLLISPSSRRRSASRLSNGDRARRRNQRGLASHEWLLLIAAVAGFTALATFVLAETVDDAVARAGADDPARLASARRAAALVENEAKTITPEASGGTWRLHLWGEWEDHFRAKCLNIQNAFRSAAVQIHVEPDPDDTDTPPGEVPPIHRPKNKQDREEVMVKLDGTFKTNVARVLARANEDPPASGKPQVRCEVTTTP